MKTFYLVTLTALLLAGCGGAEGEPAPAERPSGGPAATAAAAPAEAPAAAAPAPQARQTPAAPPSAEGGQTEPAPPPAVQRTRRLDTFDEEAVFWAMYHYAGVTPPLRQWAEESWMQATTRRQVAVDEFFDREAFIDELTEELAQPYRAAADIGVVPVLLKATLGRYDTQFQEFYLEPFSPNRTVRAYSATLKRQANIHLVNALDAYAWALSPDEAKAVVDGYLDRYGRRDTREILIEAQLRLVDAEVDRQSGNGNLNAEILSYRVYRSDGGAAGALLHSATLAESGS